MDIAKTVLERKLIMHDAMKVFEASCENDMYWMVNTYSQLVKDLAADRPDTFQQVLIALRKERKK